MASEPARPGSPLPARSGCGSHGYVYRVCSDSIQHRVVNHFGILSSLELRPLAILVGSSPRWDVGLTRVSPTDVHILSYHSDVSVVSENGEDNIVEFEMIARDPE